MSSFGVLTVSRSAGLVLLASALPLPACVAAPAHDTTPMSAASERDMIEAECSVTGKAAQAAQAAGACDAFRRAFYQAGLSDTIATIAIDAISPDAASVRIAIIGRTETVDLQFSSMDRSMTRSSWMRFASDVAGHIAA